MQKYSAIILSEEISTTEVVKLYLGEFENIDVSRVCNEVSQASDFLNNAGNSSLLIVDLSCNLQDKLDFILDTSKSVKNCAILALCDNPTVDLIIKVMRSGAKEFLQLPLIKNEFFESINKIISENKKEKTNSKCKIISIFSNKGGIGKTTIATNLAVELSKITKENIALIDLNFQMGDITTFLDLKPSFNISYMLNNLDKIDETFLRSTLERYKKTNLYVLADPPFFKQAEDIKPKQINKLFEVLKETFSYIIVDAQAGFGGKSIAALDNSDIVMLVTVANLPALRNTQRCLELFSKLGYDKDKVKIVVNRYMENDEIKEEDITKLLSTDIFWKIPNNYFSIMKAINKGLPVSDINEETNVAQSYRQMAKYISDNSYRLNMIEQFERILKS